jgi:hypothetical protein
MDEIRSSEMEIGVHFIVRLRTLSVNPKDVGSKRHLPGMIMFRKGMTIS